MIRFSSKILPSIQLEKTKKLLKSKKKNKNRELLKVKSLKSKLK